MPQTFDYMGARRAGYSVKEIQQATKDIDIQNALEQWGEKFFQKQARQREAVNSMVRASRNRASAGLTPAQTLYPAGVTRDPIGQDMQNMATAPRVPRPTGIVRAENVAPDLVSAFEQAPESSLGDATSGYLAEAPSVKLRGARGIVQGVKDVPKAAWLGLNQAASAGMQAIGDVVQEDIGILTKAAKATSDLLTLNMSPTEIPADTGSNVIQRVGRDAYAVHTQGMQELSDKYAPDSWGGAVMNAGAQAGQQLGILGTAAAIGIRNPAAMTNFSLGALGAQSGLTEYGDARAKGFDVPRSLLKAGVGGGMEVVTEVAPMGKLVNFMSTPAKKGVAAFLKDAAEYGLQDIGGELLNTMITDVVNSKMQARPNMTPQEQADEVSRYFSSGEWKQAAATTFKQALLQSGMMMGAAKGVQHLDGKIRGEQSPLTDGVTFQPQNLPPVNPERQGRVDKLAGIMANESERTAQMRLNIANQRRDQQPVTAPPAQQVEQVAPEVVQPVAPAIESAQQQEIPAQVVPTAEAPETPVATPSPEAASAPAQDAEDIAPELADLLRRKTNLEKAIFAADGTEKKTATKRMKDNYAALTATITALQPQNPEQEEVATNGQQAEPETAAEPGAVATDAAGGIGGTAPADETGMGSAEAVPGGAVSGVDEQSGDGMPLLRTQPDVAEAPQATTAPSPDIMALVDGNTDDQVQKTIDMVRGLNPERAGQIEAYWKSKATPVPEPQTGQEPAPAAQDGRESVPPAGDAPNITVPAPNTEADAPNIASGRALFSPDQLAEFDKRGIDVSKVPAQYKNEALQQLGFQQEQESKLASPDYDANVQAEYDRIEAARKETVPSPRLEPAKQSVDKRLDPTSMEVRLDSKLRSKAIKQSKESGAKHLDQVEHSVEAMRGKRIRSIFDGSTGTITSANSDNSINMVWDDEKSAGHNSASLEEYPSGRNGKTVQQWTSRLTRHDISDFEILPETRRVSRGVVTQPPVPKPILKPLVTPSEDQGKAAATSGPSATKAQEGYRPTVSRLTPAGKRGSAQAYTVHLSPSQAMSLKEIRQEVSDGEAGGRVGIYNDSAPGTTQVAWGSSFPGYFQNRGLTKKQVLPILDRIIRGESVTEAQWLIAEDMLKAKRYDTLNRILNERAERQAESHVSMSQEELDAAKEDALDFFSQFGGEDETTKETTGAVRADEREGAGRGDTSPVDTDRGAAPATDTIDGSGWGQQVAAELSGSKKALRFGDKERAGRKVGLSEFMDEFTPDPQQGLFGGTVTLDSMGLQQIYERLASTKLVKDAMADLKRLGQHVYAQGSTAWKPWFQGMKDSLGKLFRRFRPTMEKLYATTKSDARYSKGGKDADNNGFAGDKGIRSNERQDNASDRSDGGAMPQYADSEHKGSAERVRRLAEIISEDLGGEPVVLSVARQGSETDDGRRVSGAFGRELIYVTNHSKSIIDFHGVVFDDKTIFVEESTPLPHMVVIGHELLHSIKLADENNGTSHYNDFANAIKKEVELNGYLAYVKDKRAVLLDPEVAPEMVYEEVLGDFIGDRLTDKDFWNKIFRTQPSLARRVMQSIKTLIEKAKSHFKKTDAIFKDLQKAENMAADFLSRHMRRVARGTVAAEDNAPASPKFSLRTDRTGDPRVDAVLDKIGSPDKTLADRIKDSLGNLAHKETRMREIEQGFFDRYASLRYLDKMAGITGPDDSSYIAARMTTSFSDVMYAMVHHGHPIWKDGGSAVSGKGLMEIFEPVADEIDVFMGWMVGARAQKLMNEGRERYFDQDEINILKGLKTPENSARWEKVRRDYMQYKKQVLDFAEQSGVINPEARRIWDHEEYVPFYRVVEDKPKGPFKVKGLASQNSGIRALKGADERLGDIFENIIRNFSHLTDAAIKNRATELAVQKAEQIGAATPAPLEWKAVKIGNQQVVDAVHEFFGETQDDIDAFVNPEEMEAFTTFFHPAKPMGKDVIHVLRDGKPQYYQVHDDLLLRSMTSINEQIWGGPAMTFMRFVKRLLTIGVTSDPTFMLRNFIRDTLHTWTISRGDFTPVISSLTGAVKAFREDDDMVQLMAAGGAFHGGFAYGNDPAAVKLMVRKLITKKGIDRNTILDTVKKVWEAYQEIGSAMENAARVQTYANVKAKTGSHLQAAFDAKDIMDFSVRGDWAAINFLVQTVPFLGARIQGLQRLGKGAMENPVAFTLKGTAIALASTLLWLHNRLRPEYQELEEWDKDTYFHFFVGKKHFRLPKPFEVGAIFGTIPERLMELTLEKQHDGGLFFERMMAILTQTFAVGLPQILSEPAQQWANKDFFTGREIVGRDLQRLLPGEQSTPYTSVTAKGLGRAVNFSPKRIEHAVKGYFGALGMYCLGASDMLVRKLWDYPARPTTKPEDWPVLSAFYRGEGPARNTKYTTEFYELLREADQLTDTVQRLRETGEVPRAEKLIEKNLPKLAAGGILGQAQSELSKINKQMKIVHLNRSMSPDEKRAQLVELQRIKNEITRGVVGQAKDERNQ